MTADKDENKHRQAAFKAWKTIKRRKREKSPINLILLQVNVNFLQKIRKKRKSRVKKGKIIGSFAKKVTKTIDGYQIEMCALIFRAFFKKCSRRFLNGYS
jgi:hypothetical protein